MNKQTAKEKAIKFLKQQDSMFGESTYLKAIDIALSEQQKQHDLELASARSEVYELMNKQLNENEAKHEKELKVQRISLQNLYDDGIVLINQHKEEIKKYENKYKVWKCNKCDSQLVEKSTKDYVDDRINRMSRHCKNELVVQREKIKEIIKNKCDVENIACSCAKCLCKSIDEAFPK